MTFITHEIPGDLGAVCQELGTEIKYLTNYSPPGKGQALCDSDQLGVHRGHQSRDEMFAEKAIHCQYFFIY